MKRIFELTITDIQQMNGKMLKEVIKHSEGRTVMAETIVAAQPYILGISNPELASAFGADMITLNLFDFEAPFVFGWDDCTLNPLQGFAQYGIGCSERARQNLSNNQYIEELRKLVGRLIGVNLEPVPEGSNYPMGFRLNLANLEKVKGYGFDYIMVTANPNTGVTTEGIKEGIKLAKEVLGDETLIIAGKMHGAGAGNIYEAQDIREFVVAGADVVLMPAPGTVPGFDEPLARELVEVIHQEGALAMSTIGTSQEGAPVAVIQQIALMSKMAGVDIQHIGDCGTFGMALPENIMELSKTIRGIRHTYRRMGQSINR